MFIQNEVTEEDMERPKFVARCVDSYVFHTHICIYVCGGMRKAGIFPTPTPLLPLPSPTHPPTPSLNSLTHSLFHSPNTRTRSNIRFVDSVFLENVALDAGGGIEMSLAENVRA